MKNKVRGGGTSRWKLEWLTPSLGLGSGIYKAECAGSVNEIWG